jgi:hypothetical protein
MTVRLSTGLVNALTQGQGFSAALNMGYIKVFSGAQPASADAAETGTLLGIFTRNSGALTKETRATGSVTITGATGGTINNITVGGLNIIPDGAITVSGDTTSTLAAKLADAINRNGIMEATVSGAVVTLRGRPGTGVTTAAVTGSLTTATATFANMGTGAGVAPVNGLFFDPPSNGVIAKPAAQVWSFNGLAVGTAGWARFYSSDNADTGALLTAAPWYSRLDGSCGVGSGDFQMSTISITASLPVTMDTFTWTQPKS